MVRVRLRSTFEWLTGEWAFASTYPEAEELALALCDCDPDTGELIAELDEDENAVTVPRGWTALVRRDDIDVMFIQDRRHAI